LIVAIGSVVICASFRAEGAKPHLLRDVL
jgi:hypothetical protein